MNVEQAEQLMGELNREAPCTITVDQLVRQMFSEGRTPVTVQTVLRTGCRS